MTLSVHTLQTLGDAVGNLDLFICCGSFEDRCLAVAHALAGSTISSVIVAEHVNLHRHVAQNVANLMTFFGTRAIGLGVSSNSPVETADKMLDLLTEYRRGSRRRVLVDITTFTHESLLILMQILARVFTKEDSIRFVYTLAKEYAAGIPENEKWLSRGIESVRSILGYPGEMLPGQGCHLILLHGFEAERSKSLITEYEPHLLSLGRPNAQADPWDKHVAPNTRVHEEVKRFAAGTMEISEFSFPPDDPRGSCAAVAQQAALRHDLSVVAAPMNTKLSAIGVALAARTHRRIQVCYAQPNSYNYAGYSVADDRCCLFDLPEFWTDPAQA